MKVMCRRLWSLLSFAVALSLFASASVGCGFVKPKTALAGLERLPAFPEPPPATATKLPLSSSVLVEPPPESLGAIHDRLAEVFETAGIDKWHVYAFGDGFAMVTRWERIEEDGAPASDRFPARMPSMKRTGFDMDDQAQVLFNAPPGDYRLFVFLVTGSDGASSAEVPIEGDRVDAGELPAPIAHKVPENAEVTALVYLHRRRGNGPAEAVELGLTAQKHLVAAGLFDPSELGEP
jgi:hypothetical protein